MPAEKSGAGEAEMAKRVALAKRDREKMRERLLARRAELLTDLDGTE